MSSRFLGDVPPAQSVQEILHADGEMFVRWAYLTMLGRAADPTGLAFYLRRMREGKSKISILKQMKKSAEGRDHNAHLPGLDGAIRRAMLTRAPMIGPIYRWISKDAKGHPASAE